MSSKEPFILVLALVSAGVLLTGFRVSHFDFAPGHVELGAPQAQQRSLRSAVDVVLPAVEAASLVDSPDRIERQKWPSAYYLPNPGTLKYGNGKYGDSRAWAEAILKPNTSKKRGEPPRSVHDLHPGNPVCL